MGGAAQQGGVPRIIVEVEDRLWVFRLNRSQNVTKIAGGIGGAAAGDGAA